MQEYLDKLDLPLKGDVTENQYKVTFKSSDMFDKYYLIFSRYDFLHFNEDKSDLTLEGANLYWTDEDEGYEISLIADYNDDVYTCLVEKN